MYNSYEITLNKAGSWSFGNDFVKHVIIFVVQSLSSNADYCKDIVLV